MGILDYRAIGVIDVEDGKVEFEVLPEHLKLLRAAYIDWQTEGWGAPQIDPHKPYGLSKKSFADDIIGILEFPWDTDEATLRRFHEGTGLALQIILTTGKFKAAKFRAPKYTQDWKEYRPKKGKKDDPEPDDTSDDHSTV